MDAQGEGVQSLALRLRERVAEGDWESVAELGAELTGALGKLLEMVSSDSSLVMLGGDDSVPLVPIADADEASAIAVAAASAIATCGQAVEQGSTFGVGLYAQAARAEVRRLAEFAGRELSEIQDPAAGLVI